MSEIELKLRILEIAAPLAAATMKPEDAVVDGKLDDQEKLANVELWLRAQTFAAGIAAGLKAENASTFGFEDIASLVKSVGVSGDLKDVAAEAAKKAVDLIPGQG